MTDKLRSLFGNTLPEYIEDVYRDIYDGVAGLASLKRRDDLPMIREIAVWAVKYRLEQTCEAVIGAFRALPDGANLPVISLIEEKFPLGHGRAVLHVDIIRSLCAHKFPQTVPLLAPFVQDNFAGHEVEASLSEIVGQDWDRRRSHGWIGTEPITRLTAKTS